MSAALPTNWSREDLEALLEAFRHRTGVDLTTAKVAPAEAWRAYLARLNAFRRRSRQKRAL